jgi:TorA maturation chaperone TorD
VTTATHGGIGTAAAWRLLSLGFTPPTSELLEEVRLLAESLCDVDATPQLADLLESLRRTNTADASAQHASLFRGAVRVAPYEGSYEIDPIRQGRQMADVAAFYRAFGAEAHGPVAERPDFVGCELEFLSFLELRRLVAVEGDDQVEIVERIRDAFLTDHAGRWLPTFLAHVIAAAEEAHLYRALAAYGTAVLADELRRLDLSPSRLSRRRQGSSPDASTFDCGSAG